MTRELVVCLKKLQADQSLGGLVRCMMTGLQIVGMMRPLHQKNLSPEEREETWDPSCVGMTGLFFDEFLSSKIYLID